MQAKALVGMKGDAGPQKLGILGALMKPLIDESLHAGHHRPMMAYGPILLGNLLIIL